ncbi:hypothetical protein EWE75_23400 [Sphingomonas populi]|uniref:Ester cyclase n=1 Tax=Sphingomonas populi TaxID=2484750 RepID=A0A4Q6XGS4_9SPHN|nr:ester cyclase [Sphingomonas populi]RZF59130.1 hypothetical protein EWE75_23400 [Sphingomonas populi]
MAGYIPPFTLDDFSPSVEKRAEITKGLTERQAFMANRWMSLFDTLNRGDFEKMDDFFDASKMTYANPNRPDLGSYAQWKPGALELYNTFPPCVYRVLKAWGNGDDEVTVLCHHHGKHTGAPYMGVQPTGNQLDSLWFSWIKFEGDKIVHIYSISDVLSMLIDLEVISAPQPVDPYK